MVISDGDSVWIGPSNKDIKHLRLPGVEMGERVTFLTEVWTVLF